jgi:hypothetical protein
MTQGVIIQRRFTRGSETRLQPNRQRSDFQDLVDDERKLAALTDAFDAKVTPAIVAEIMGRPETAGILYPRAAADLESLQFVNTFKSHCKQTIHTQNWQMQRGIGNFLYHFKLHLKCPLKQTIAISDAQYRWYWIAYFPLGSPAEMAPPNNYTFRPPSFLENFIGLFNSQKSIDSEETIRQQITQYESSLEEMIRTLGNQNQVAREIDSSEVTAWPAKYRAWLTRRQTEVKIQEVSLCQILFLSGISQWVYRSSTTLVS